jgi:hypothetical protein
MEGGTVVTASGATLIIGGEATGAAAGADADETAADEVDAAAGAATGAGTGAESLAAHPSLPRKLIKEALPDGRLAASLTAVDSTIVFSCLFLDLIYWEQGWSRVVSSCCPDVVPFLISPLASLLRLPISLLCRSRYGTIILCILSFLLHPPINKSDS